MTVRSRFLPAFVLGTLVVAVTLLPSGVAGAAPAVGLGTTEAFAVLGASTVTNTGPTVISGDVGLSPGTSVTGFPPGIVNGTLHVTDGVAAQAQTDATTAYDAAAGLTPTGAVTADLAGQALVPGVYRGPTLSLTGALTLDGGGDAGAVFVFQAGSTLTLGSGSVVSLINGASACNVFWQVGSSAALGTSSTLAGTVVALTSVTAATGARVEGRLIARTGAVTLDTNTVTRPLCGGLVVAPAPAATPTATVDAPVAASPTPSASPSASPTTSPGASPAAATSPSPAPPPLASPSPPAAVPASAQPLSIAAPTLTPVPSGNSPDQLAPGPGPQAPPLPPGSTPQLPTTGASTDLVLPAGLLSVLTGGLLLVASRTPRPRGAHQRSRRYPR